jgi:hypothetical protein
MIVGARCTNPKCDNAKNKTIFTDTTALTNAGLGGWNGPWKCPGCNEMMYTERRGTDKEDGQKKSPTKGYWHHVSKTASSTKPSRKKAPPKKTGKKYIGKKS